MTQHIPHDFIKQFSVNICNSLIEKVFCDFDLQFCGMNTLTDLCGRSQIIQPQH